ncbi:hypothetical protein WN55_07415 [Dufourea novaeangliae]|uniref:YDG domain-containing protein n=2 Tax=Dufourea novaeangliae TaxID=178035 RepID=A0A154PTZ6_DUFNO|nr:hypothetical protein WN55_07415 [Dufourea novaeangliae]
MAKNDSSMILCTNTVQENESILHESSSKHQIDAKSNEDFEKLFMKLNYICQLKASKEEVQSTTWNNKNVITYTYGAIQAFPSGSWWGIRMDCSRDRVHDPFDENMQIGPFGVTSICTSNSNLNEDVDFGNSLTLTGEKYLDGKSDRDPLIKNYENKIPVRLIRSYNLLNEFAPKTGYRYDGLYVVANCWIGINSDATKYYKFALVRLNNQEPPLWSIQQSPLSGSKSYSVAQLMSLTLRSSSENTSSSPQEFRKYLHSSERIIQKRKREKSTGYLQSPNFESKRSDEKEKCTSESAIVTRHVFKKGNAESTSGAPSMSTTSESKSLTHIGAQGSKAHNTNISIRTGLYDSSHNTQNDIKKNIMPQFCRTAKPLNFLKTNQYTETLNFSNIDKSRSSDGKVQIIGANEFTKRVNYISPNTVKPDALKIKSSTEISDSPTDLISCYKSENNTGKTYENVINDFKDVLETNASVSDTSTNILNTTNISTHKLLPKEAQDLKSLDSLDTLTPDKILHLINKKCHPLSKLLMGNMIGVTSEQSIALKPHDLLTVQSENKNKVELQESSMKETKEKKDSSDDLLATKYYKFRRHRRLSRTMMSKPDVRKCEKIYNKEFQEGSVQPLDSLEQSAMDFNMLEEDALNSNKHNTDVKDIIVKQKQINYLPESTKNVNKNAGARSEIRTRLRTMKAIKSSMKKHINKKQRREITNLLIDAKIGPKIRGPRNRRLRCISNTYTKHTHERFAAGMCTLNKCRMNSEISGQQSSFRNRSRIAKIRSYKRIKDKQSGSIKNSEALKENRIHKNLTVSKKVDKNEIINNNNNSVGDNNKKSKSVKTNVEATMMPMVANRKRKLMCSVSTKLRGSKFKQEIHGNSDKEDSKPCKTDAVTQCSLIKEPLMRNLKLYDFGQKCNRSEQYTFIKIEYGESKDVKSETCEATKSDRGKKNQQKYKKDEKYKCTKSMCNTQYPKPTNTLLSNNSLHTREQSKSSMERDDLKIARLRSIGFKPIISNNSTESVIDQSKGNSSETFSSKVLKQNVAEKYNKYTNEENDVVVYMDDELQYQDIEDEDKNSYNTKRKALKTEGCTSDNDQEERESCNNSRLLLEQDLESPWHGWRKVVTNTDTYWVGW